MAIFSTPNRWPSAATAYQNELSTWLLSIKPTCGVSPRGRRTRFLSIFMNIGWIWLNEELKMSDTDEHGHEHPKHELSHYAKRVYAIRDLLLEKGVLTEK